VCAESAVLTGMSARAHDGGNAQDIEAIVELASAAVPVSGEARDTRTSTMKPG